MGFLANLMRRRCIKRATRPTPPPPSSAMLWAGETILQRSRLQFIQGEKFSPVDMAQLIQTAEWGLKQAWARHATRKECE